MGDVKIYVKIQKTKKGDTMSKNFQDKIEKAMKNNNIPEGNVPEFKEKVKEWLELDNQIKQFTVDMKEVKKRHADLKKVILKFMESNEIGTCNVMGGEQQLALASRETKVKPKKPDILRRMAEFINSEFKVELDDAKEISIRLYDYSFEPVESKTSVSLSRKMTKKGLQKKREEEAAAEENEADMEM